MIESTWPCEDGGWYIVAVRGAEVVAERFEVLDRT
jgi:hypothetical protein